MSSVGINRFEWLKAAMQAEELNSTAKLVASALAVEFANGETGQLNPSVQTLARYLKVSGDTAKRAVKALIEAGWLARSEGRGRGNKTSYQLLSPGKIVPLTTPKKGADMPGQKGGNAAPLPAKKGANLHGKGGKFAPSHYKEEQSLEQKADALERYHNHTFAGNCTSGPQTLSKSKHWNALNAWSDWVSENGFPDLCRMPVWKSTAKGTYFLLPYRQPPDTPEKADEARAYFEELIGVTEVCYATQ